MALSSQFLEHLIDEFARLPSIGRKTAQRLALHILRGPREEAARLAEALLLVKDRVSFCSRCGNYTEQDPCAYCCDTGRDQTLVCVVEQPVDVLAIERTASYRGVYHVLGGALSPLEGIGPENLRVRELLGRLNGHEVAPGRPDAPSRPEAPSRSGGDRQLAPERVEGQLAPGRVEQQLAPGRVERQLAPGQVADSTRAGGGAGAEDTGTAELEGFTFGDAPVGDAPVAVRAAVREVILATNPTVNGEATAMYLQRLLAPLGVRVTRIARGVPVGSDLEYSDQVTLARALEGRKEMD